MLYVFRFFYFLQEMYGEFIDELINPSLLKPFDEIFELQLPLRNAKLKFHSQVWGWIILFITRKFHKIYLKLCNLLLCDRNIRRCHPAYVSCTSKEIELTMIQLRDSKHWWLMYGFCMVSIWMHASNPMHRRDTHISTRKFIFSLK